MIGTSDTVENPGGLTACIRLCLLCFAGGSMRPVIDLNKKYGIVLEGGGARGAYQIGAWKALREAGVRIRGVAGTSVGALNGAFISMDHLEEAEQVWKNITYSRVMDVDDDYMQRLFHGELPLKEAVSRVLKKIGEGGVDIKPLRELIRNQVDITALQNSSIPLYILTFQVDAMQELELNLQEADPETICDYLVASACIFPLFKNQKLDGKTFIDGGAINNVPLDTLIRRGYEDIIMIRIFGPGREKRVRIPEGTQVLQIRPRVRLGSIIDFNAKKSKRNMKIGYYDAKRLIYGLKGKIYYIEENQEECYYLNQFIRAAEPVRESMEEIYHLSPDPERWLRRLTEIILPAMALELKLSVNWNYRELYLAILEATARLCHVPKYQIYTVDELKREILERKRILEKSEKIPIFTSFITGKICGRSESLKEEQGGNVDEFDRT